MSGMYLLAQLVVAGNLFTLLLGVGYGAGVVLTALAIVFYVAVGGMHATTAIQAVKAFLMVGLLMLMAILLVVRFDGDLANLWSQAVAPFGGLDPLSPGNLLTRPWDTVSTSLSLTLGLAGLPHIMMRFFTVRDSADARKSAVGAIGIITIASLLIALVSLGAAALLRPERAEMAATGGNLVTPRLAQVLGGGPGTLGGSVALGILSAVAFASVIAVAAGLLINASSAAVRDLWGELDRRQGRTRGSEVRRARFTTVVVGILLAVLAIGLGPKVNSTLLVTLAFGIAASTNFPVLMMSLTWRRFTARAAVTTVVVGLVAALVLIALGPRLWPGANPPINLSDPTLISMPLAFLAGWIATVLPSRQRSATDDDFAAFQIDAEVGRHVLTPRLRGKSGTRPVDVET
jgi:cation/acetate symporter